MTKTRFRKLLDLAAKLFIVGWAIRNVIGVLAVIPVFTKMIEMGGTPMAIWLAFCSVAGIALNILLPTLAYRKLRAKLA